ncbi:MAG: 3'-5' exoribonuclease YhaM family protein, partial [Bradymonadaceae bacterium]
FVEDLNAHDYVQSVFLTTDKQRRRTKNDDPYLAVTFADRTGRIEGRVWENVEALDRRFEADDFVGVEGEVSTYNGELQIKVRDLKRVADDEVQLRKFLRHTRWEIDELFDQLRSVVDREVTRAPIREFLGTLLGDEDRRDAFVHAPAGKSKHHDYIGGLLEHTLSMIRIGVDLADHYDTYYPDLVDRSLLVAGCVLHDFGKIDELEYDRSIAYTTEGQLVGHVAGGAELVGRVADAMEGQLPDELLQQLKHLVLSHHGHREYGAPVEPKTPEAMLLHEIDMIDSGMNQFHQAVRSHRDGPNGEAEWTEYDRGMETRLFAGAPDDAAPSGDQPPSAGPGASPAADEQTASETDGDPSDDDQETEDSRTVDMFGAD